MPRGVQCPTTPHYPSQGPVDLAGLGFDGAQLLGHHHEAHPAQPHVALIVRGEAGLGDVVAATELDDVATGLRIGGQALAHGNVVFLAAGDHLAFVVQQGHHRPVLLAAKSAKNAFHLIIKPERQAQHAQQLASVVLDAARIDQGPVFRRAQVGAPEGFHMISGSQRLGQRLGQQRISTEAHLIGGIVVGQHLAVGRQHQDLVVHRILGDVLLEPMLDGLAANAIATKNAADIFIGRPKAHIGRALEQVADPAWQRLRACRPSRAGWSWLRPDRSSWPWSRSGAK